MRQSLVGLINFWRKKQPKRLALITPTCRVTYSQLWKKANAFAEIIMQKEVNFLGIAASRHDLIIISLVATMLCKKKFLIFDTTSEYFSEVVRNSKVDALISDLDSSLDLGVPVIKMSDSSTTPSFCGWKSIFDYSLDMNDEVGAFLSSGTTGVPKVFTRSNYSLVSEAFLWIFELQLTSKTTFYLNSPFSYIGSFVLLYSVLYAGGTIVVAGIGKSLQRMQVSYAFYTVKAIKDILNQEHIDALPVCAKKVLTMGAPIDYDTKKKFAELYHCDVLEMWGNSEGLATLISLHDIHASKGSIGRATFTDDLFITDKNGHRLEPYQVGYISGITDNDTTAAENEIITSEDLGYKDEDEYFYLVGRENNVILFSSQKYFSTIQFEKYIKEHGQVNDCAVTISPDRVHINVFVVVGCSGDIESLCQSYINTFSGNLLLGRIIVLDEIPYNKNEKINYSALNQLLDNG